MPVHVAHVVCFSALCIAITAAEAGTVLQTVSRDLTGSGAASTAITTYAQDGRMRVEAQPGEVVTIFKDDAIYSINARDKTYFVMDRAAMKRMADQINPALKQMQEQMAKMPPEQRAHMEKMMGGSMPGASKSRQIVKSGRNDKISGYACNYVEIREDGALSDELCVAAANTIKGSRELMAAAAKMSALLEDLVSSFEAPWLKETIARQAAMYDKIGGVPVLARHYDARGKAANETTLKSVRSDTLSASLFDIPAGYTKKDMAAQR